MGRSRILLRWVVAGGALAALLAACAVEPPVALSPAEGRDIWQRSIALALAEWDRFGGQIVYTAVGADGREARVINPVRVWEDDGAAYETMRAYWRAVGEGGFDAYAECFAGWRRKCPWHMPWSAAFLSYVMIEAGAPRGSFPPGDEHWTYVRHIVKQAGGPGALFVPESVTAYRPRPGDIVCKTRAGAPPPPFDELVRDPDQFGDFLPMHCDIVVSNNVSAFVAPSRVAAIGGNVMNSVSKSLIPTRAGYLETGLGGKWFVILRAVHGGMTAPTS